MTMPITRSAYRQLIQQDLEWLAKQPDTLERRHIKAILEASEKHEYDDQKTIAELKTKVDELSLVVADAGLHD